MKTGVAVAFVAAMALGAASRAATPGGGVVSGQYGSFSWEARSTIVGSSSTATIAGGGAPRFLATNPRYTGVAALVMDYGAAGGFICSGSLLPDRRTIITAAHCVSDGFGTAGPVSTTAWFNPQATDDVVPTVNTPASVPLAVSQIFVNPDYTGAVIDQNDIALLRLAAPAPDFARSYGLTNLGNPGGQTFNVAGYGARSNQGGAVGTAAGQGLPTGRLRQGDNRFDFRWGDPQFGGLFTDPVFFDSIANNSWISDFDSGAVDNDASCLIGSAFFLDGPKFCDLGRGNMEVSVAGGDSGGPQFINGRIVSITSYGLTFGADFGDAFPGLNSSYGEFNGFVPVAIHKSWIEQTLGFAVPEPQTWAMLIAGFGLVGGVMRRRRAVAA
jgi:hypothetical protein